MSRGWYFPDVLWDRQVELAYLGYVLPLGSKPGLARSFYISNKNILNPPDNTSVHTIGANLHHLYDKSTA